MGVSNGSPYSLVALSLEVCAAILPDADANFSAMEINVHFCKLFIAQFKLLKLHSKVRLFK